jgi:excisionase family DNA binding protein
MLTVAEAAQIAYASESTLRAWIRRGLLPAHRFGPKRLVIRRVDLLDLLKSCSVR